MARPKKVSLTKIIICSIICFIIGVVGGGFFKLYISTPGSYLIPATVSASSNTTHEGDINIETIKSNDLSIHFLELGNKYTGDCTFIKIGNIEILVDAGSRASSVQTIYDYINPYVEGELDYVIVTHAHQDHYAGFATANSLFDKFEILNVIEFAKTNQKPTSTLYSNYLNEKQELETKMESLGKNCSIKKVTDYVGETERNINLGNNVTLQFLYQKYYEESATTENNYSVCFQLVQKVGSQEKRYLFTGDLEKDGEESLVNENEGLLGEVELYKAGHHGSKTSSSTKLLSVIKPKTVCVCCCAGSPEYTKTNANQFPTQDFINRISEHTEKVYVTSLCVDYTNGKFTSMNGNIVICASESESKVNIEIYFSNNSTLLKDTDWFKANRTMPQKWAKVA